MVIDLQLTQQELLQLERQAGAGYNLSGAPQQEFLECTADCDVQAAPGSGKTTLLVVKLHRLIDRWKSSSAGICVLSHTNTARHEIERQVVTHPTSSALLQYPHFVGTLTNFVHTFIARPFLRGRMHPVAIVDNELFGKNALMAAASNRVLSRWRGGMGKSLKYEQTIRGLTYEKGFSIRLRSPGPHTDTGKALKELKDRLRDDGIFRYEDMTSFALESIGANPWLADRIAARFPFVFVDEMQDTPSRHLAIVEAIFRRRAVLQCLGDCNQRIFEEDEEDSDATWRPGQHCSVINLGTSRRFGQGIARVASKLTCYEAQEIEGARSEEAIHRLVLFDENTKHEVIRTFGDAVMMECAKFVSKGDFQAWVIASRIRGQNSLGDYVHGYHPIDDAQFLPETLAGALDVAVRKIRQTGELSKGMRIYTAAIVQIFRRLRIRPIADRWTIGGFWRDVSILDDDLAIALRRALRASIVEPESLASNWQRACHWIEDRFRAHSSIPARSFEAEVDAVLSDQGMRIMPTTNGQRSSVVFAADSTIYMHETESGVLPIRLDSIAKVKGQTHDATMIVQTKAKSTLDLRKAIECIFGNAALPTADQPDVRKAITNVFVGVSRPKFLLALALPVADISNVSVEGAKAMGWDICNLTGTIPGSGQRLTHSTTQRSERRRSKA